MSDGGFDCRTRHAADRGPGFPSLIDEGQPGGGYDVRFELPGVPLFLQFKLVHQMVKANTNEAKKGQRFLAGDWQPSELDGGRLCEALARALYQLDSAPSRSRRKLAKVTRKLDDQKLPHKLGPKDPTHLIKVLGTVYKLRSDRGAVHVSAQYLANHMDPMWFSTSANGCSQSSSASLGIRIAKSSRR